MRIPHRQDPREPWPAEEITPLYAATPADPAWPEVDVCDPEPSSGLLGPDGEPLPAPDPMPFEFQPAHQETTP